MDIKKISINIRETVAQSVVWLKLQGVEPKISVILVGDDDASLMYAETKKKVAEGLGITVEIERFPATISQVELERHIAIRSHDTKIHGVLLESPFPFGLDYAKALSRVDPLKDIDGLHEANLGKLQSGSLDSAILPATPLACLHLMEQWGGKVTGKHVVLVGSGRTVGKPLAMLLLHHGATVTACNASTPNIAEKCRNADIIVSAVGKPRLITTEMVTKDSLVIDVGTALNEAGKMVGDVDYEAVQQVAKFVTPVPGWVGMITTGIVFQNLIRAIQLQKQRDHFELSLNDFFVLASDSTMPWGGGIAAMVAILGASMTSMVYSLTRQLPEVSNFLRIPWLIELLKEVYRSDIRVFESYLAGIKLPKSTPLEQEIRSQAMQKSLIDACLVPLNFWEIVLDLLKITHECAVVGNKQVLSDIQVATHLLASSLNSAFAAVDQNLTSIRDVTQSKEIADQKRQMIMEMESLVLKIQATLAQRSHIPLKVEMNKNEKK